ncbi:sensor histidine kinase [Cellulomonas palmilytica]|uniref:sensor histidine kinase n=1 Tax=Cellulomonas palmilytica TaxID=2608402 RepID=UPI001F2264C9|nr:HAMP domain-containing sensor histidine kinase [Cellulomonas palmilytica]
MSLTDPGPVPPPPPRRGGAAGAATNAPVPPTTSTTEPVTEQTTAEERADATTGGLHWWRGMPLSGRLVAISTVLLLVGLVLAGVTATALLQRTLVGQVDDKLRTEGLALVNATAGTPPWEGSGPPTDYLGVYVKDGRFGTLFAPRTSALHERGVPNLPALTVEQAQAREGRPFTVSSDTGSKWRAVAYPGTENSTGETVAIIIALPLEDVSATVRSMIGVLAVSGVVILLLGGLAGWWAVRRSLRPLRQIEHTAAAFAAGDFSQRVPPAPTSTEVGRLGAALNGMLAQVEQAFAARTASEARMRRFVSDASHELRTPLAAIRGYGELYRMGALTSKEQVDDTFSRIEGSATRMGTLVEDLLSLARLDEKREARREPVDLTVVAADAVSDLRALDPTRTTRIVPLTSGGATGPVVVQGDEAHVRQVVANLVGNVVQHTPAGTPVEIAVGLAQRTPGPDEPAGPDTPVGVIEVRDHGPGIDPEHAARVFERFYRVDASRGRDSGGSGLGMAIVAAIVTAHDGHVDLTQTPGGGTTVRVELPTAPETRTD